MDFPLQLFLYSRRTTLAEQVKAQHQYPHQFQPARSWGQLGCWDTRLTPNLALAGGPLGTTIPRASGTGLSPPKPGAEASPASHVTSIPPGTVGDRGWTPMQRAFGAQMPLGQLCVSALGRTASLHRGHALPTGLLLPGELLQEERGWFIYDLFLMKSAGTRPQSPRFRWCQVALSRVV